MRGTASERFAFQRQRAVNIGEASNACSSRSPTVSGLRNPDSVSSGKVWGIPSESTIASSVAAAWSSWLNPWQKRFRSASPKPRLIRPP